MASTLSRAERIGTSDEVRRLHRARNRVSGATVAIRYAPADNRRVAFTTRGIKLAVTRNLVKRRLKEIYRQNKNCFPENCEYLFIARPAAAEKDFAALETEVLTLGRSLSGQDVARA